MSATVVGVTEEQRTIFVLRVTELHEKSNLKPIKEVTRKIIIIDSI